MVKKARDKARIKQNAGKDLNISPLEHYRCRGSTLTPPPATLPQLAFGSWRDASLNEILWAAVLCGDLERENYLDLFRQLVANARHNIPEPENTFLTYSVLSLLSNEAFDIFVRPLLDHDRTKELLRSVLLVECLPDRHHWSRHLEVPDAETHSVFLMKAVATCLDHQSQESTDIRWLKICYFAIVCDRLRISLDEARAREAIEELRLYPEYGDQRKVRPSNRALELGLRMANEGTVPPAVPSTLISNYPKNWNEKFWDELFSKSPCIPVAPQSGPEINAGDYIKQLIDIYTALSEHFIVTDASTNVDARHDATFGITLFAVNLAIGAGRGNVHRRAEGRLILRTIVENYITLKFLEKKDDPTIWLQYRNYGVGQSKLTLFKNVRSEELPDFISLDDLQRYANEDVWQEFTTINLRSWAERNVRQMAEVAG